MSEFQVGDGQTKVIVNLQEKLEEFWGRCFHPETKVVYTSDYYKVSKEEFIDYLSALIEQERKEAVIEELEEIIKYPTAVIFDGNFEKNTLIYVKDIQDRIKQLKEGKDA